MIHVYIYDKDILAIDHLFYYIANQTFGYLSRKTVFFNMNFKNISHMYLDISNKCIPLTFNATYKLEIHNE